MVKVAPEASTNLVFPGIDNDPVVKVSSPFIWKVPLFVIEPPLSSNSYPAKAKIADALIVRVPEELRSNLSPKLTAPLVFEIVAL